MKGNNHQIVNIALAIGTENLFHLAGPVFHYADIAPRLAHPGTTVGEWAVKGVYYSCAFLVAKLPDADLRMSCFGKHRGFTHSLLGWFLFALSLLATGLLAVFLLQTSNISVSQEDVSLGIVAISSSALGYFYHLVADSLTVAGIAFLWPSSVPLRLLPRLYALRTGHHWEYLVVYALALAFGFLIWRNLLGI